MTHAPKDEGIDRRAFMSSGLRGLGALGLSPALLQSQTSSDPLPHYAAKAQNVIFLYMDGGVSSVDTFDPKPRLAREDGKPFGLQMEPTQFEDNGGTLASPWRFRRYGACGLEVSDLFPNVGRCADKLAVVRSMVSDFSEHTNANYFLHTGHGLQGRPSMGSWIAYGRGTQRSNSGLPGFVVLDGGLTPPGGLDNFGSAFLSAQHQATVFRSQSKASAAPIANLVSANRQDQRRTLDFLMKLDRAALTRYGPAPAIEAALANRELAYSMQESVPEAADFSRESEATRRLYGFDHPYAHTRSYARQCLLARRLIERGVRFIELTCPKVKGDRWDQHRQLKAGHENNARAVDQPIAALLRDLERQGLLETTLVVWAGEFGRTPFAQGRDGRDHNPFGFSIWLAGAGIKGGVVHGATDDYGYKAVDGITTIHDLHATILHLLGIDHERLTYRFGGRDLRLTDVYGRRIHQILR